MSLKFLLRTRHWSDGAIIGSKAFAQEVAWQFQDRQCVMDKQLSRAIRVNGRNAAVTGQVKWRIITYSYFKGKLHHIDYVDSSGKVSRSERRYN